MNSVRGRPVGCLERWKLWTLHACFSTRFFHTCHGYRHHWLLPYFIPHSATLTLAEGHKISWKQNLLASFSRILFNWPGWNVIGYWSKSGWRPWFYFWERFDRNKGNNCCLLAVSKILTLTCIRTVINGFGSNLVWWSIPFNSAFWF